MRQLDLPYFPICENNRVGCPQGWFSFKHDYVFVSETLAGEALGLEAIDERYYRIYFAQFPIATFDSHKRHVESMRKANQR